VRITSGPDITHTLRRSGAAATITRGSDPGAKRSGADDPEPPQDTHRTASSSRHGDHPSRPAGHRDPWRPDRGKAPGHTGHAMHPGVSRRLPARAARSEKAYAASTTPEIPISARVTTRSIPDGCCPEQRPYQIDLAMDQRLYPLAYLTHRVGGLRGGQR